VAVPTTNPSARVTVGAARALISGDAADKTARPENRVAIRLSDIAIACSFVLSLLVEDSVAKHGGNAGLLSIDHEPRDAPETREGIVSVCRSISPAWRPLARGFETITVTRLLPG
jgi:hypothetical protein